MYNYFQNLFWSSIIILVFFSCDQASTLEENLVYFTDAETVKGKHFDSGQGTFNDVKRQTNTQSHSGSYSISLTKECPYGFTKAFKNIKKGEVFCMSAWMLCDDLEKKGNIVISDAHAEQFDNSSQVVQKDENWVLLQNVFTANKDYEEVKTYAYYNGEKNAYFDDFKIIRKSNSIRPPVNDSTLRIHIPKKDFEKLNKYIDSGRKENILNQELKKYVKGFIIQDEDSMPIQLRLKGDWTDHLKSSKYSLRIKVQGDNSYEGLETFSIQNPETRSFMKEWFIHELCDQEDILTTTYKFVNVEINGEVKGVYALEEHFDKQLVESRNRKEGPIIKLDETGMWQLNIDLANSETKVDAPAFESSTILPFKKNRTLSDSLLRNYFLKAQDQLNKYKNLSPNPDSFLDLKRFAMYIAILDIGNIEHASEWHNQRQFYNPLFSKLEPVLYDCFQEPGHGKKRKPFLLIPDHDGLQRPTNLNLALMNSEKFRGLYLEATSKLCAPGYLEGFIQKKENEIKAYGKLLSYDYPFYNFDISFFQSNQSEMLDSLKELEHFIADFNGIKFEKDTWNPVSNKRKVFRPDLALKAHTARILNDKKEIELRNFHLSQIEIYAYSTDKNPNELIKLDKVISFDSYRGEITTKEITLPIDAKYLHYYPENLNGESKKAEISVWPFPAEPDDILSLKSTEVQENEKSLKKYFGFIRNADLDPYSVKVKKFNYT